MYDYENYNYENAEKGESMEFSKSCNPDFKDSSGDECQDYDRRRYCDRNNAGDFVMFATVNEHGIWETGLQCPQCGCGADGAANLNDVYAEKGRQV